MFEFIILTLMFVIFLKLKKETKNLMDCFDKEDEEDDMEHTSLAERLEKKTGIKSPTSKVNGEPKTEAAAEKPAKKKQGQCL